MFPFPPPGARPPGRGRRAPPLSLLLPLLGGAWLPTTAGAPVPQEAAREIEELERRCGVRVVPSGEIEAAIRSRRGYDLTAAPNQGRFVAELLLDLAERHRARRPDGPPLLIRQEEFFPAFLRATGLRAEEAPPAFRAARRVGQTMVVEHRRDRVLERVVKGPEPRRALSVRATWPDRDGLPSSYTYDDTLADPRLRVRHDRDVSFRLLEFAAVVAYDQVEGVSGRPTSGPLGLLFELLGMASLQESRFVVAGDRQVVFTRVRKLLPRAAVATVSPEGRARIGIPRELPGHRRLRTMVEAGFEVQYAAPPPPLCPRAAETGVPGRRAGAPRSAAPASSIGAPAPRRGATPLP